MTWYATGGKGLSEGVQHAAQEIIDAAMRGLKEGADEVLALSQERVPVLDEADQSKGRTSGKLKSTGKTSAQPERLRVAVSYGTPYAAYIHEHVDFKHPNGGQAKFLESAITEKRNDLAQIIADAIREVTG